MTNNNFGGKSYQMEGEVSDDERTWGIVSHLSQLVLGPIGPLVIYLIKKEESQFVSRNALQALAFSIAILIATLIIGALSFLLACIIIGLFLPFLYVPLFVLAILYAVVGALRASERMVYEYPVTAGFVQKYAK